MRTPHVIVAALLTVTLMIFAFEVGSHLRTGGFMPAMAVFIGAIWLFAARD